MAQTLVTSIRRPQSGKICVYLPVCVCEWVCVTVFLGQNAKRDCWFCHQGVQLSWVAMSNALRWAWQCHVALIISGKAKRQRLVGLRMPKLGRAMARDMGQKVYAKAVGLPSQQQQGGVAGHSSWLHVNAPQENCSAFLDALGNPTAYH